MNLLDFLSSKELVISFRDKGAVVTPPPVDPNNPPPVVPPPPPVNPTYDLTATRLLMEGFNDRLDPIGISNYGELAPIGAPTHVIAYVPGFTRDKACYTWSGALRAPADGEFTFRLAVNPAGYLQFDNDVVWSLERKEASGYTVTTFKKTLVKGQLYDIKACLIGMTLSYKGFELKWVGPGITVDKPGNDDQDGYAAIPSLYFVPPSNWQSRLKTFVPPPVVVVPPPVITPTNQYIPPQPDPNTYQSPTLPVDLKIFPDDSPWNRDISKEPVDVDSDKIMAAIGNLHLHPIFGKTVGIPYNLLDENTPNLPVSFWVASESDPGPYPIPNNPVLEWQGVRFPLGEGDGKPENDVHYIGVDPVNKKLYEIYQLEANGAGPVVTSWRAYSGAKFDFTKNEQRTLGWTSADAAGLAIFPGLIKYEELIAGEIKHPIRISVPRTDKSFVFPATHFTNHYPNSNNPPMGSILRLKDSFDTSIFKPMVKAILDCLKKYGGIVADNGGPFIGIMGVPDSRLDDGLLGEMKKVFTAGNFDVIQMIGRTSTV